MIVDPCDMKVNKKAFDNAICIYVKVAQSCLLFATPWMPIKFIIYVHIYIVLK